MKPAPFDYLAPQSLEEAVSLLAQHGDEAKVLAGGQSLVPMMVFRLATPAVLVDLNRVGELDYQRSERGTLVLGALTRHRTVADLGLGQRCAMLAEGVDLIGHPAIRNRGTVGGSLAHADPAAEWPAILLALGGEVEVAGSGGRRTIGAVDLFVTYFTTSLASDEILTEIRLPLPDGDGRDGSSFVELARRHGDFAVVGVAAVMKLAGNGAVVKADVVLIGVGDRPVRARSVEAALTGGEPNDDALSEAAATVSADIDPVSDLHGSADYRRRVAAVLTRRALSMARDRAQLR